MSIQYAVFDPGQVEFVTSSSKVFDRNGTFLWEISKDNSVRNTPIKFSEVSNNCVNGIIAIEDRTYWSNSGIDLNGLGRFTISLFTGGSLGGGSTITQQVIKTANQRIFERNPVDKLNEMSQSLKLTSAYTKEEILMMYLNNVYFGNLNYGIESASRDYFLKSAKDLNLAECSYLAGIPQWPGVYNPHGNVNLGKERQKQVLNAMMVQGLISQSQYDEAVKYELKFNLKGIEVRAPHFVQFIQDTVVNDALNTDNVNLLNTSDFDHVLADPFSSAKFNTTYDYELHKKSLEIAKSVIDSAPAESNLNNAGVVILDKDFNIVTMLGSIDFFNNEISGKFNATLGKRQPGTALTDMVYYQTLENGRNLADYYSTLPFSVNIWREKDEKYERVEVKNTVEAPDPETLLNSFLNNYEVPTVRLTQDIGYRSVQSTLDKFRVIVNSNEENRDRCNEVLVLEGCEMTLLDMAYLYNTIANKGNSQKINYLNSVYSSSDDQIYTFKKSAESNYWRYLDDISDIKYSLSEWNFVKGDILTGKDTMAIGFRRNGYTIAVWAGNTDGEKMNGVTSDLYALRIVQELAGRL